MIWSLQSFCAVLVFDFPASCVMSGSYLIILTTDKIFQNDLLFLNN